MSCQVTCYMSGYMLHVTCQVTCYMSGYMLHVTCQVTCYRKSQKNVFQLKPPNKPLVFQLKPPKKYLVLSNMLNPHNLVQKNLREAKPKTTLSD